MKKFAGRLYNKDESNLLGVITAMNKKQARQKLRKVYGKEYKIGQIFEDKTERSVGKHKLKPKTIESASCLRDYSHEEKCRLLEAELDFWCEMSIREEAKYDQLKEDSPDAYRKSGLPKKLGLKPIEPGSKYDREHFDERGRRITRKEWKRRRKAAVAS